MLERAGPALDGWRGKRAVEGAAFSGDGAHLVSVSSKLQGNVWDGQLRLFEVADEKANVTLKTGCATALMTSLSDVQWVTEAKTVATAADDGNVYVYSIDDVGGLKEFCLQRTLADHEDIVTSLAVSRETRVLTSGSYDGSVKRWDVARPEAPIVSLTPEDWSGAWKPPIVWDVSDCGGKETHLLASAHQDGRVQLWDARAQQQPIESFSAPSPRTGACLSLSSSVFETSYLAAGFESGLVGILDLRAGFVDNGGDTRHGGAVHRVETFVTPENGKTCLVSASDDGMVLAALTATDGDSSSVASASASVPDERSHGDYARALAIRPRGDRTNQHVVSGGWDGLLQPYMWVESDKVVTI
ncbi:WD repeat-containing protein 38 [Hondaea fermentalgiana]|uniref:WD repeat-containing protein 38 n=1 Tax=Hondaea fermentalgiana TaxID=2315210 RepID=A0A2R5G7B9_9STRA|nr:WD repeat-containing protein 38 [Hondaea fermentalgiana]|eukprot:GBG24353.1 WD repeat-containing protein 38 [Hondaea fermentalgiana]